MAIPTVTFDEVVRGDTWDQITFTQQDTQKVDFSTASRIRAMMKVTGRYADPPVVVWDTQQGSALGEVGKITLAEVTPLVTGGISPNGYTIELEVTFGSKPKTYGRLLRKVEDHYVQ